MKHWLAMALTLLMMLTVGVAQAEQWTCKYDSTVNQWNYCGMCGRSRQEAMVTSASAPTIETPEKYFSWTTQDRLVDGGSSQKVMITGYNGRDTDIVIPKTIKGKPVVGIGASAFSGSGITSVVIPEGVTGIMFCAFYNCYNLKSVSLPASIINGNFIGVDAFSDCYRLKDVYYAGSRSVRTTFTDCGLDDATWHYQ